MSQKMNFWGQGNKEGSPRLPLGEERTNILLLACCYQEGSNPNGISSLRCNLALRLKPVLICLALVAAALLIEFIGPLGDTWCKIKRLPGRQRGFLFCAQRFEAGDDVEQLLVDATLAQTMECPVEIVQQFVDVFFGALHGGQPARVLARERFGARPKQRDKKIFADECAQSRGAAAHDFGQGPARPADVGQTLLPLRVERQQPLADRLVERPGLRAVMEDIKPRILTLRPMRFAFDLNLADNAAGR